MSLEPLRGGGSSWQSGSRPVQPLVSSMDEARRKIDDYDKSLPRTWAEATLPWAGRLVAGDLADRRYYLPENNRLAQAIPQRLANTVDTCVTYHDLLGIGGASVQKPKDLSWQAFLKDKQTHLDYREALHRNFAGLRVPVTTPARYLKDTVFKLNIANLVADLQEGRLFPFLARTLGVGFFGWKALRETQKAYQRAKTQEDGSLKSKLQTLFQTTTVFAKESVKAVVAWELGTIGFIFGSSLVCVGVIPAIVAGCLVGGLFEAAFLKLVSVGPDQGAQDAQDVLPQKH